MRPELVSETMSAGFPLSCSSPPVPTCLNLNSTLRHTQQISRSWRMKNPIGQHIPPLSSAWIQYILICDTILDEITCIVWLALSPLPFSLSLSPLDLPPAKISLNQAASFWQSFSTYILKANKSAEKVRKSRRQNIATKVRQSIKV